MTEVNYRRNGRRYSRRTPHRMRFWWAGKYGYWDRGWDADYKRACKHAITRVRRRHEHHRLLRRALDELDLLR